MTKLLEPDICVIGAGSGGLSVAAAAAAFGVDVVLLEKGKMGGDCLNYGCVPSKAMIAAGKVAETFRTAGKFGIGALEPKVDFQKVHEHVQSVIGTIEPHDSEERFTGLGVTVIREMGCFVDAETVQAGNTTIKARRFVIATGSSPFVPPIPGIDTVDYLTNETLFENTKKMKKLVVIGGGPIGMEMAQAHHRLGCNVTVIEGAKALGKDDPELTAILMEQLRGEGIEILEETSVTAVTNKGKEKIEVECDAKGERLVVTGSHVLVATGRAVNVDGLNLEAAGIEYSRRGIAVSPDLRTTNRRVYAIGDVAGGLQFTHVAGYHAGLVIRGILFRMKASPKPSIIPWVTYTEPELAQVGLSEAQAKETYSDIKVLTWDYDQNDRAVADRKTTGKIKLITKKNNTIIGVSIVGASAGEMINMWALAVSKNLKLGDIAGYISPYPTMTEIGKRAAVTNYAPMAKKPLVRWVVRFLRKFG